MALSGWIIASVVLFALLHILLYIVYSHGTMEHDRGGLFADSPRMHNRTVPDGDGGQGESGSGPERLEQPEGETVTCPSCGAINRADASYIYCWNCISRVHE